MSNSQNAQQPLSKEEISRGKYVVETLHPLTEVPIYKALPYLGAVKNLLKKPNDQERRNLVQSDQLKEGKQAQDMAKQKTKDPSKNQFANMIGSGQANDIEGAFNAKGHQQPNPKPQFQENEDPVDYLGLGVTSYFQVLRVLMFTFFVLTILHIPVMSMYKSHGNFNEETGEKASLKLSLGSMGFSQVKCTQTGMATDRIVLSCKTGFIGKIVDFGLNARFENRDMCIRNQNGVCHGSFNEKIVRQDLESTCLNQESCKINSLRSYVKFNQTVCLDEDAQFFVQYYCTQSHEELSVKREEGALVGAIAVFSCFFFIIMIFYLRQLTQIQKVRWDLDTLTAGDYTVDLNISRDQYQTFVNQHYAKYGNDPQGYALKKYLKFELEQKLTNAVEPQGFEKIDQVRIADIQFSYRNASLINLLNKRGLAIKANDWKALKSISEDLDRVKTRNYQDLMIAVGAFVTFENEEGYQRCLTLKNRSSKVQVLGKKAQVREAPEPTNIIWENRQYTTGRRVMIGLLVSIIIAFLLLISFSIILSLKKIAVNSKAKYQYSNCKDISDIYNKVLLEDYAVQEWYDYYQPTGKLLPKTQISSVLDCFCKEQKKKYGFNVPNQLFNDLNGKSAYVCNEWFQDIYLNKAIGSSISVSINVINSILKLILIKLISMIGEDTRSATIRSIKVGVFVTQFFNTGILLLLSSANFQETKVPYLNSFNKGQFTDFTEDWYRDVGSIIIKALSIASIMPIVEFVMMWSVKNGLRLLDRSFKGDQYKSKKKSIQLYVDIYSGPDYMIHLRFSTILNLTFVCFMYGTALPLLYPIALWSFFVLYSLERILVCYYYKQPPNLDDKLTQNSLLMLLWAPIVHMMLSYWFLSNNQIFDNMLFPLEKVSDVVKNGHTVIQEFRDITFDQSFPCLMVFFILAICVPFGKIGFAIINYFKPGILDVNLNVDENLGNFYEALEEEDKKWMQAEESNLRKKYGMRTLLDETVEKLGRSKTAERTIQGVHCYDMLANPDYQASFQYVPVNVPNRSLFIQDDDEDESNDEIQCDLIRIALNLAMLDADKAQKLSFEKEKLIALFKK
eukprot:403334704